MDTTLWTIQIRVIPVVQYSALVMELQALINHVMFLIRYREKETYFTRNTAKMTFQELIAFVLKLPKASMQAEVNRFLREFKPSETMAKTSLMEARLKISPYAFSAINDFIVGRAYEGGDYKSFKGYRLVAVDGSVFDANAGAEESFGTLKTPGNPVVKAKVLALVDVLNDLTLKAIMGGYAENERDQAIEAIECLREKTQIRDLYTFDRGFPSRELIGELEDKGLRFLMRVSTNFVKAVTQAKEADQIVQIKDDKGITRNLRVVNVVLPTGEIEKLITNEFSFSLDELKELYRLRWGIERKYLELKELLQIENFTGSRLELILQDFYATVAVSNLAALAKQEAQFLNEKMSPAKQRKYEYKINTNLTIATLRDTLVFALLEDNPRKARKAVTASLMTIRKCLVPIRTDRPSTPRVSKNHAQKFPLSKKRSW